MALGFSGIALPVAAQAVTQTYHVQIRRQRLDAALKDLAQQTGLQIIRFSDTPGGEAVVGPLTGNLSIGEALNSLLAPHELAYRLLNEHTIAVVALSAQSIAPSPKMTGTDHTSDGASSVPLSDMGAKEENKRTSTMLRVAQSGQVNVAGAAAQTHSSDLSTRSAAESTSSTDLAEVVVTARRMEERLQDVPISITVLNQPELTNRNIFDSEDIAKYVPSLSLDDFFGSDNSTFSIRGFVQDIGTPPSVGVYFADVVAPRGPASGYVAGDGAGPGYLFDLQNIQVLKGPQGTLFGRNTTGGAVLFVPQKPTDKFEGYLEGSYGNYDMRRVQGVLNMPLSDTLRVRLAVDDQRRNGYLENISGIGPRDFDDVNYTAVRASVVWDATSNLENYTIASFSRSDTNGPLQKLIACAPGNGLAAFACPQLARERHAGAGFDTVENDQQAPASLMEQWQIINTTTWRATDSLTLKSILSAAQLRDSINTALFGTNWPVQPGLAPLAFSHLDAAPGLWGTDQSTISAEIQAQGSAMNDRLSYQAGFYMEVSNPINDAGTQPPITISCANSATLQCTDILGIGETALLGFPVPVGSVNYNVERTSLKNFGVYEQSTYNITDQLRATAGVRYTWDEDFNSSDRYLYTFPVTAPFTAPPARSCVDTSEEPSCHQYTSEGSRAPTWVLDLEYKPIDDLMMYGKYSRGYRAGGVFAPAPSNYRDFQPEKVDTYEAGFKSTFNQAVHGTFDATGFYNDFRNQQLSVAFDAAPGVAVAPTSAIVNAGKSRIWGAEVGSSVEPVTRLTFRADYTYLNTKITRIAPLVSADPLYVIAAQIPVGSQLVLSPKNKFSISGDYRLPLNQEIGRITFGAILSYTSQQLANYAYTNPAAIAAMGGDFGILRTRHLLDLNLNWTSIFGSPIDGSLFGTNITDQHYYNDIAGFGAQTGLESAQIGPPRMYGLRIRYHIGE
jgi:iron complex outermembrane receptor protein